MTRIHKLAAWPLSAAATALLLLGTAPRASFAADAATFAHPALAGHRAAQPPAIDPNTFIVQPPAAVQWTVRAPRSTYDHPAVAVARMNRAARLAGTSQIDSNQFLVQPPVAVTWTVMPQAHRVALK